MVSLLLTTRFAVVATENPFPEHAATEMGLVFHPTGDRPGLLHDLLTPFKIYDVNLTKIENRPTGKEIGDYLFYLHFEGNSNNARVQKVLEEFENFDDVEIAKILGEW